MICRHTFSERESSVETEGYCPICMGATILRQDAEIERMRTAIRWALGEAPDDAGAHFGDVRPPLEARYWWRTALRRMSGMGNLAYDKATRTIVDRADQQTAATKQEG